jgi:hypothetical protein
MSFVTAVPTLDLQESAVAIEQLREQQPQAELDVTNTSSKANPSPAKTPNADWTAQSSDDVNDTNSTHDMGKGTRLGSRFEEHSAGSSEDIVGKR